jgi:hypothetical protein
MNPGGASTVGSEWGEAVVDREVENDGTRGQARVARVENGGWRVRRIDRVGGRVK